MLLLVSQAKATFGSFTLHLSFLFETSNGSVQTFLAEVPHMVIFSIALSFHCPPGISLEAALVPCLTVPKAKVSPCAYLAVSKANRLSCAHLIATRMAEAETEYDNQSMGGESVGGVLFISRRSI